MSSVKRLVPRALLFVLLGLALPAAAQTGGMQSGPFDGMSSDIVVPAAVRVDGKNSAFFQTDLWIRCKTVPVSATLYFHPADAASSSPAATVPITLTQPVVYLPDVLSATFGVPRSAGNIRIVAGAPISAVARVYNNGGGGAFGLSFMGTPVCRRLLLPPDPGPTMSLQSMPMMGGSYGMDDFSEVHAGPPARGPGPASTRASSRRRRRRRLDS